MPIGGGVGFKWPGGWGIEVLAETQKRTRDFDSGVRFDSTVTAARARLIRYFGSGRTQPYAGARLWRDAHRVDARVTFRLRAGQQRVYLHGQRHLSKRVDGGHMERLRRSGQSAQAARRSRAPEFEFSMAGEHIRMGGVVETATR